MTKTSVITKPNMSDDTSKSFVQNTYDRLKSFIPAILGIIILFTLGQILSPGFASAGNIATIITAASVLAIAGIGQSFVILSGNFGIDMSVGAIMSTGALIAPMIGGGANGYLGLSLIVVILVGAMFGLINGVGVQLLKIPALAMTLVMTFVVNGATLAVTKGQPGLTVPSILKSVGKPIAGQIRPLMLIAIILVVATQLFLRYSKYGKSLMITGSNRNASRLSGVKVNMTVLIAYMLGGIFASVAGMLFVGYVGSGQLMMADSYTMMSVAAVVIGGAKLSGGSGNMIGTALGAIVIVALSSVLVAVGLDVGIQRFFEGLILILIVLINNRAPKLRS